MNVEYHYLKRDREREREDFGVGFRYVLYIGSMYLINLWDQASDGL